MWFVVAVSTSLVLLTLGQGQQEETGSLRLADPEQRAIHAEKRDVAYISRDFPYGHVRVYMWRDTKMECLHCMYSVMVMRTDEEFRTMGETVQWKVAPWEMIEGSGSDSMTLDATVPWEHYILQVTSEATGTCRLYDIFPAGDRPAYKRRGKCRYQGMPPMGLNTNQIPDVNQIPVPNVNQVPVSNNINQIPNPYPNQVPIPQYPSNSQLQNVINTALHNMHIAQTAANNALNNAQGAAQNAANSAMASAQNAANNALAAVNPNVNVYRRRRLLDLLLSALE